MTWWSTMCWGMWSAAASPFPCVGNMPTPSCWSPAGNTWPSTPPTTSSVASAISTGRSTAGWRASFSTGGTWRTRRGEWPASPRPWACPSWRNCPAALALPMRRSSEEPSWSWRATRKKKKSSAAWPGGSPAICPSPRQGLSRTRSWSRRCWERCPCGRRSLLRQVKPSRRKRRLPPPRLRKSRSWTARLFTAAPSTGRLPRRCISPTPWSSPIPPGPAPSIPGRISPRRGGKTSLTGAS